MIRDDWRNQHTAYTEVIDGPASRIIVKKCECGAPVKSVTANYCLECSVKHMKLNSNRARAKRKHKCADCRALVWEEAARCQSCARKHWWHQQSGQRLSDRGDDRPRKRQVKGECLCGAPITGNQKRCHR